MTTNKKEYLSALLDGESGHFEQRRLTQEIATDDTMKQSLTNYALISELIRNADSSTPIASNDFLSKLNKRLDLEQPLNESTSIKTPDFSSKKTQPWISFALVASFASLATLGVQTFTTTSQDIKQPIQTLVESSQKQPNILEGNHPSNIITATQDENWEYDPEMQEQLRSYVKQHSKYSSLTGIMHSVRAASYSTEY